MYVHMYTVCKHRDLEEKRETSSKKYHENFYSPTNSEVIFSTKWDNATGQRDKVVKIVTVPPELVGI